MKTPFEIHRPSGAAKLLLLLGKFAPAEWIGDTAVYVANGNVVSDAELAESLKVSERTIACCRCGLRAAGLIGWLVLPRCGRVFWLNAAAYQVLVGILDAQQQFRVTEVLAEIPLASGMVQ